MYDTNDIYKDLAGQRKNLKVYLQEYLILANS